MKRSDLYNFCCPSCKRDLNIKSFIPDNNDTDNIVEGVLYCELCKTFYPILERIPLLLDRYFYQDIDLVSFMERWSKKFDFAVYDNQKKRDAAEKIRQVDFFNSDSINYDDAVTNSTFWKSSDWNTLYRWITEIPEDAVVLDLGCGTGRCAIPLSKAGKRVFATDISMGMIKVALKKADELGINNVTYFLADAEELPIKPNIFSTIICFGVMHHVNNPETIISSAANLLRSGGVFYALENNNSSLRAVFDFLMKYRKLWDEEAGSSPLFNKSDLEIMIKKYGMKVKIKTSTFLPPHIFNLMGFKASKILLSLTDAILQRIPVIENFGGQLVIRAEKA
jgi:ubiquinone/menaquinone biosynthesis C-methylase UbiE/uncharacterized protein YbaR (Trm112 family)